MDAANRLGSETTSIERPAGGRGRRRLQDRSCAIAIMAKASALGRTKTRLVPPLTFEQAAALNTAFLQDMVGNLLAAGSHTVIAGYVAFAPAGTEAFFRDILPPDIGLIDSWLPSLGDCLVHTIKEIFVRGHAAAVVLNSDIADLALGRNSRHIGEPRRARRSRPIHRWGLLPARTENRASPFVRGHRLGHRKGCRADPGTGARTKTRDAHAATLVRRGRRGRVAPAAQRIGIRARRSGQARHAVLPRRNRHLDAQPDGRRIDRRLARTPLGSA
jgi:hypothetical protein